MSGNPSTSTTGTNKGKEPQEPPRLFYSKSTEEDFICQFNEVLAKRDSSFEKTLQSISDNLAAFTAALLERGKSSTPPPSSKVTVTLSSSSQLTPDIDITPPPEKEEPSHEHSEFSEPSEHLKHQGSLDSHTAFRKFRDPRYLPSQKHMMATLSSALQRLLLIRELSVPSTPAQQGSGNQDGRLPLSILLLRFKGHNGENVIF